MKRGSASPSAPVTRSKRELDVGAWELAKQLGLTLPTGTRATPAERKKRAQLQAELDADLAAPLVDQAGR